MVLTGREERTLAIISALLVFFTALWDPRISFTLAVILILLHLLYMQKFHWHTKRTIPHQKRKEL